MSSGSSRPSRGASKATPAASPTLRRWELAARLRELRLAANRSVDEVAAELMCSAAKISRMETAGRGVQPRDIRDLVRFYGLPATVRDELMSLADEARKPGWWQSYRTLPETTANFVGLEASAVDVRALDALRIPGLMQTEPYTRAMLERIRPPGELSDQVQDEWADVRQRRQELLTAGRLRFASIIDESALARQVGSPAIMAGQVRHLLMLGDLPSVTLQIVPFTHGVHPGLDGSFQWMRFGAGQIGDVVFVEGLLGLYLLDKDLDVDRYREIYEYISRSVALDPAASRSWLTEWLAQLST